METREAILRTLEAYGILAQLGVLVEGQERVLLMSSAKTVRKSTEETDRVAWEIADFLPIALGRVTLIEKGAKLEPHYARIDLKGRLRTYRLLADEPVYVECERLAPELYATQHDLAERIAQISVERQMFDTALAAGSRIADLEAGPPVLNGPEELCYPLDQQPTFAAAEKPFWLVELEQQNRPWWKFW